MKFQKAILQICHASLIFLLFGCEQKPKDGLDAHQLGAQEGLEHFQDSFAQKDSTIQVGTTLSNAVAVFGEPLTTITNADGSEQAIFIFMPGAAPLAKGDTLTNGFTLLVSNGIIVSKEYSFTTSP